MLENRQGNTREHKITKNKNSSLNIQQEYSKLGTPMKRKEEELYPKIPGLTPKSERKCNGKRKVNTLKNFFNEKGKVNSLPKYPVQAEQKIMIPPQIQTKLPVKKS